MVSRKECEVTCKKERNAKGCEFNKVNQNGLGWCWSFTIQVKPSLRMKKYLGEMNHMNIFKEQRCLSL